METKQRLREMVDNAQRRVGVLEDALREVSWLVQEKHHDCMPFPGNCDRCSYEDILRRARVSSTASGGADAKP